MSRGRYNQIGNFVLTQSEINIAIGDKPPEQYFCELAEQCHGGKKRYGGITDPAELRANLRANCVPERLLDGEVPDYDDFLEERRRLMALKIQAWFDALWYRPGGATITGRHAPRPGGGSCRGARSEGRPRLGCS